MLLHGRGGDHEGLRDALVRLALGQLHEDIPLPWRQLVERPFVAAPADHPAHDLGVEGAAAVGDAGDGVREAGDVTDPLLQQVADPLRALADQVEGVLLLVVLGEDENSGLGKATT